MITEHWLNSGELSSVALIDIVIVSVDLTVCMQVLLLPLGRICIILMFWSYIIEPCGTMQKEPCGTESKLQDVILWYYLDRSVIIWTEPIKRMDISCMDASPCVWLFLLVCVPQLAQTYYKTVNVMIFQQV